MTSERWARLKALFDQAVEQPPFAREAWADGACGDDAGLRTELLRLLASHDTAGAFLESPPEVDAADLEAAAATLSGPAGLPGDTEWSPGTRVGKYEILDVLGRGGMGIVYLARDADLGREVALKSITHAIANQPALRTRLRREARAAATIRSRSVATVYALDEIDGHVLVSSEHVSGPTVRQLIAQGPLAPSKALDLAMDVARALVAAHEAGVIHRDLKPENIVVGENGRAKVVDFGIAYFDDGDPRLTRDGQLLGTPAYMAPEQLAGGDVDARTDVYALGVVVQEMLLGRHPALQARGTAKRGAAGPFEVEPLVSPPPGDPEGVRDRLQAVAERCAQSDPGARYATASEALAALEAVRLRESPNKIIPGAGGAHAGHPRWWWEFHQGAVAVAYALILVPAWRVRGEIGGVTGRLLFTAAAAAVIVSGLLRLHLWFTSRFYPSELAWARDRAHRWILVADWAFVITLAASAALAGPRSTLDIVLIACAVGTAVAFLVIEPATARAAGLARPD